MLLMEMLFDVEDKKEDSLEDFINKLTKGEQ